MTEPIDAAECLLLLTRSSLIFLFLAVDSFAAPSGLFSDNKLLAAPRPLRDVGGNEDKGGNLKSTEALRCFSFEKLKVLAEEAALTEEFDSFDGVLLVFISTDV